MAAVEAGAATTAAVSVAFDTVPMAHTPDLDGQPVVDFKVAFAVALSHCRRTTFNQAHVSNHAGPVLFVGQIWPQDIVEDVCFERGNSGWESGHPFGPCSW